MRCDEVEMSVGPGYHFEFEIESLVLEILMRKDLGL